MGLIDKITDFCCHEYEFYGECNNCTHPSGRCSGSCEICSEEINYHNRPGRKQYDCQKFMYYYTCRYSWKYCSEIIYALTEKENGIDLEQFPLYNILSLGCGGAPDLMAFDYINEHKKYINYTGYDISTYWGPIHNEIIRYYDDAENINVEFHRKDIIDAFKSKEILNKQYNVIILEYFISHFINSNNTKNVEELLYKIINQILPNRVADSKFLLIINDIDHYMVRDYFDYIVKVLKNEKIHGIRIKRHFKIRNKDFKDKSYQYDNCTNFFTIPEKIKDKFDCAISCTSAQLIIQLEI